LGGGESPRSPSATHLSCFAEEAEAEEREELMYQSWAEMGGGNIDVAKEHALYEGAFEAMKQLPPGVYTSRGLARRLSQFPRFTVMAAVWRMVDRGLARLTPTSRVRILPPKEESND